MDVIFPFNSRTGERFVELCQTTLSSSKWRHGGDKCFTLVKHIDVLLGRLLQHNLAIVKSSVGKSGTFNTQYHIRTHVSSDVATFGVGDVQVLATILTLWLADKSGRRLLLIVSSSAMALSLLVVSISFYLKEYISPDSDLYATLSLVSVAGVVVMVIAFSLGLGAMPWIIMSEILPINIKGLAGSFTILANWFFSWLVTLTANLLLDWSSGGTFTIYTAVCVFTAGFVAIWVPETKGKTLEEIQQFFR
ncbi:hypothetical protein KIW84_042861 [Lathyrus oleraceus]|uniref:Major facilitator superfamily (MFS) profile domain-containing protein n=1 Tax=Pisum sativum TaxID=3888 RepID=A0A9D4XGM8_PEA|nr:hypothetical protein KIW84_042861 [Pisum sativum]